MPPLPPGSIVAIARALCNYYFFLINSPLLAVLKSGQQKS